MTDLGSLSPSHRMPPFRDGTVRDSAAFRARLEQWRRHVETKQHNLFKAVIIEAFTKLVYANPVGEPSRWQHPRKGYVGGHSRRNWQVSTVPQVPEQPGAGDPGQAITAGIAKAQSIPVAVKKAYIVNPVAYMEQLERGWSKQQPAGWIRAILDGVLRKYARVK